MVYLNRRVSLQMELKKEKINKLNLKDLYELKQVVQGELNRNTTSTEPTEFWVKLAALNNYISFQLRERLLNEYFE